jgi:hypothetical protein
MEDIRHNIDLPKRVNKFLEHVISINGKLEESELNDFKKLVRESNYNNLIELLRITFYVRSIKYGFGRRAPFYEMLIEMLKYLNFRSYYMIWKLIDEHGNLKDMLNIIKIVEKQNYFQMKNLLLDYTCLFIQEKINGGNDIQKFLPKNSRKNKDIIVQLVDHMKSVYRTYQSFNQVGINYDYMRFIDRTIPKERDYVRGGRILPKRIVKINKEQEAKIKKSQLKTQMWDNMVQHLSQKKTNVEQIICENETSKIPVNNVSYKCYLKNKDRFTFTRIPTITEELSLPSKIVDLYRTLNKVNNNFEDAWKRLVDSYSYMEIYPNVIVLDENLKGYQLSVAISTILMIDCCRNIGTPHINIYGRSGKKIDIYDAKVESLYKKIKLLEDSIDNKTRFYVGVDYDDENKVDQYLLILYFKELSKNSINTIHKFLEVKQREKLKWEKRRSYRYKQRLALKLAKIFCWNLTNDVIENEVLGFSKNKPPIVDKLPEDERLEHIDTFYYLRGCDKSIQNNIFKGMLIMSLPVNIGHIYNMIYFLQSHIIIPAVRFIKEDVASYDNPYGINLV